MRHRAPPRRVGGVERWAYTGTVSESSTVEKLVTRYFRSWQEGDLSGLRECLADKIRFDWGVATYTDPDDFVAAAASGIE